MQLLSTLASSIKEPLKKLRRAANFWLAERTSAHLEALRTAELNSVIHLLPPRARVLEVGGGAGWQAVQLARLGYEVTSIDVGDSSYAPEAVFPITVYDGRNIPFPDASFDVVFSSNVLEHVAHIDDFLRELQRVTAPNGCGVHILPSSSWRVWTIATGIIKSWRVGPPHGEHASNALAEIYYFRADWWRRRFRAAGWRVDRAGRTGLFYTGASIMDRRLGIGARRFAANFLGSSCNWFLLRPQAGVDG